ncbi:hypothetical protein IAQ61_011623 [Plenodomus lingam]|uniref:uncharacterized protein n=1 Tax=Leptosphaeria maculans TaxID=5022 RepID=UPI00331C6256|nr:hypothetical protein IAQ61_011623 [Plenodomus lingam]
MDAAVGVMERAHRNDQSSLTNWKRMDGRGRGHGEFKRWTLLLRDLELITTASSTTKSAPTKFNSNAVELTNSQESRGN